MITLTTIQIIIRILFAIGLGSVIGAERTLAGKPAGLRTYAMVSLSTSVFIIISINVIATFALPNNINPLTLAAAIIVGIGFIGGGLLVTHDDKITGLTTAASLWAMVGIGIACGFGLFLFAIIGTFAILIIFRALWFIERGSVKILYSKHKKEHEN